MSGVTVSALVSIILENLASSALEEPGVFHGLKTELENLKRTVTTIQAVLRDAEEKQWKNSSVTLWLIDLKDAAYDADDVLDELAIGTQRSRQLKDLKNQVKSFFSYDNPVAFRLKIAHKLKDVREKLHVLAQATPSFLGEGSGETEADDSRISTSVLVNDSEIYGRENEKEELINLLLTNSDDLPVYAILGMGGCGKTTLAQLIYNDERVENHFDARAWICISNCFNIERLTRAIIESIEGRPCNFQELGILQKYLQDNLAGRKILIVLDDVWDDYGNFDRLKNAIRNSSKGSSVVITTRVESVARKMADNHVHYVGLLTYDDSWLLFKRFAFGMRRPEEYEHLETIGKAIVEKCYGLPLAIKVVGTLLRSKKNASGWLIVKDSELWDLVEFGPILSALRLSYIHLPPHLKQCFAFCSIFPKDYVIEKDHLIALWIANGFISCKGQMDLHSTGCEIFNQLVGRSFFQDVEDDGLGNVTCKMHDLIHDLALSVSGNECFQMEPNSGIEVPRKVRHLAVYNKYLSDSRGIEDRFKGQSLHTFLQFNTWDNILCPNLSKQKLLRALDVSYYMSARLPNSIGNLKHLRYLDASYSVIETLPFSTSSILNLQTLILKNCYMLLALPKGMKHMKNLRHLDIKGCDSLRCMPAGMGQLTSLQKLSLFIVGDDDGHRIEELKSLNLGGELSIKDLDNVKSLADAKSANLMQKSNLQSLGLSWRGDNKSHESPEMVLCGLQPHLNMKKLGIKGYQGSNFPNWMMDLVLPNLVEISLERCERCEHLPPFGKLQFLKNLSLSWMHDVKCIGSDVYGEVEVPFPSLEKLSFCSMGGLEDWETVAGKDSFPCLVELIVDDCPKLDALPAITSVKSLIIASSSIMSLRSVMKLPSLTSLRIQDFEELAYLPDGMLQNHLLLERLEIVGLIGLKSLSNQLGNLHALKCLEVRWCLEIESLPEDLQNLKSLETLSIRYCIRLCSLPMQYLTALKDLNLNYCPELNSLPPSIQHLSALQKLRINFCEGLSSLPNQIGYLTSLVHLEIDSCPRLVSLPEGLRSLNMLRELVIQNCPILGTKCRKDEGEDWPKIAHIRNIHINDQLIQSLDDLRN